MSTHNICFYEELEKIIPMTINKYSFLTIPLFILLKVLCELAIYEYKTKIQKTMSSNIREHTFGNVSPVKIQISK